MSKWTCTKHHQAGMSLVELMIVVVIIAVLAGIGYPSYQSFMRESKRSDAHAILSKLASDQERFSSNARTYTDDLTDLGYDDADSASSPEGYWTATVDSAGAATFSLSATVAAPHSDDDCNQLILTGLGEKRSRPKGSVSFNPPGTCW